MERNLTIRISPTTLILFITFTLLVAAVIWLDYVIVLMALAFMIATGLRPFVDVFEHRLKLPHTVAVVLVFLVLLGLLALFGVVVIPTLIDQARSLADTLPSSLDKLRGSYAWLRVFDSRFAWLPPPTELAHGVQTRLTGWAASGLGLAGKIFGAMFMVFIVLISAFYILIDSRRLKDGLVALVPHGHRALFAAQLDPIGHKLGAYVRGVFSSISVLVVYLAIALTIAGEPMSLVLALMTGCFEIIPTLGPVLGAVPAILVGLTVSGKLGLIVFLIFVAGVFIQSNFIAPMLYSREVEMPPLLITVALLIGAELMGVLGAMTAVPALAVGMVLVQNVYIQPREAALRDRQAVARAMLASQTPASDEG